MKIIIASTIVPFIEGGGTLIVDWTAQKLREAGHKVEIFKIPFSHLHPYVEQQMLALRLFNLADSCDRLISIRTPSYIISHPNHIVWFIHHYRYAYELWNTKLQSGIPLTTSGFKERDAVIQADNTYLHKLKKIFTNSIEVSGRLKEYNNINSEVLYPPLLDESSFFNREYGDYIYYSSRIADNKRQLLAVQAMQYTKSKVKLLITGHPDTSHNAAILNSYIKSEGLKSKVIIISKWISEEEKIDYFSRCLAAIYIPYDEDSYGYPSLEAFASKKAVITCSDSGGTDELIVHEENGFIVNPNPKEIARTMDELYNNKKKAREMGNNAFFTLRKKGINWNNIVDKLTSKY